MSDPWVIGLILFWTLYVCFFVGLGARVLGRAHRQDDMERNRRQSAPVVVSERLTTRTVRRPRL